MNLIVMFSVLALLEIGHYIVQMCIGKRRNLRRRCFVQIIEVKPLITRHRGIVGMGIDDSAVTVGIIIDMYHIPSDRTCH